MPAMKTLKSGLLGIAIFTTALPAVAQECVLEVVTSGDATGAQLSYYSDTSFTQALLISNHAYDDGSTIVVVGQTLCDDGGVSRCIGLAVEGIRPGDSRSYWFTEILRTGDDVTVTTSGFSDPDLNQPLSDSRYTDVYRVRRCRD